MTARPATDRWEIGEPKVDALNDGWYVSVRRNNDPRDYTTIHGWTPAECRRLATLFKEAEAMRAALEEIVRIAVPDSASYWMDQEVQIKMIAKDVLSRLDASPSTRAQEEG